MKKLRVAIIAGGRSAEREISLKSGLAVYNALDKKRYDVEIWDISNDLDLILKKRNKIDIVFPLLHGRFGEDGCIQGFLKILDIPFVGSDVSASAIAMNKRISKEIFKAGGLHVADGISFKKNDQWDTEEIMKKFGTPLVVKPVSEGSSFGINICDDEKGLEKGIKNAFEYDDEILIEEYIEGTELTAPVLGYGERIEILPLVEIAPKKEFRFFDFKAKYTPGATEEICPARISPKLERMVKDCAKSAFSLLGCRVWARVDMIIREERVYILEVNTIPGMTETSLFPLSAKRAGLDFSELVEKLIILSLESYGEIKR